MLKTKNVQYVVFVAVIFGYASYYLLRKNFALAMPYLSNAYDQSELGLILSAVSIAYGFGNLIMGFMVDYLNPKRVFIIGLLLSAIINLVFGVVPLQNAFLLMFTLMFINGFAQGVGYPASSKLITQYAEHKRQQDRVITYWSIGQNIGGGLMAPLATFGMALMVLFPIFINEKYRGAFLLPGMIVLIVACVLMYVLRKVEQPHTQAAYREHVRMTQLLKGFYTNARQLMKSPYFLLILCANMIAYFIRYAILDWQPTLMGQLRHVSENQSATLYMMYEWMGILGTLLFSFLVHRYFPKRATVIGLCFMIVLLVVTSLYFYLPDSSQLVQHIAFVLIGMCVYGPLLFVNMEAMSVVSYELIGAAVGLLGFVGNVVGAAAANVIVGYFISISWQSSFLFIVIIECIGVIIFSLMILEKGKKDKKEAELDV